MAESGRDTAGQVRPFDAGWVLSRLWETLPLVSAHAAAVAGARSFNGRQFTSLAEHFGLPISAMAIRLLELKLLAD